MKKLLYLITCCILFAHVSIAQQPNTTIRGSVSNEKKLPVPSATVELFFVQTQKKVKVTISDSTGRFSFTAPAGKYLIKVNSIGYKMFTGTPLATTAESPVTELQAYTLVQEDAKSLESVEVRAKKPLLEYEADRTVVNVESMMSAPTSNTLEVLEKTPGVIVNSDGSVSLNGKTGVMILIDGRQTYMSGQALAAYLKSLPGSTLEKIELISNPPARYDAEGSAIINIKLKRNVLKGVNGNIALGYSQGKYARSNNSLNLNFGKNKFNFFTNIAYSFDGDYSDDTYDRRFFDGSNKQTSTLLLNNYSRYSNRGGNIRAGVDYALTPKTNIGAIVTASARPARDRYDYDSRAFDENQNLDSVATGGYSSRATSTNYSANVNFLHKFKQSGRELSAEVNYLDYHTAANRSLFTDINDASGSFLDDKQFRYEYPSDIKIINGQADYVHPLGKTMRIDGGVKFSSVENRAIFEHFDQESGTMVKDFNKSDDFLYKEKVGAVYASFRKNYKRLSLQAGVRGEHTTMDGRGLTTGGKAFKRSFASFFPTGFVNYKLDSAGKHVMNLSFSRRIRRPNYQQLNPFLYYMDEYTYSTGNPDLKPNYGYQAELSYRYKQLIGVTLMHNRVKDIIFQTTRVEGDKFISRPANVSDGALYVISTNITFSPFKWWKSGSNIAGGFLKLDGQADAEKLNPSLFTWRINSLQQIRISSKWSAELAGQYFGGDIQGQTVVEPRFRVGGSVQVLILKNKGSLRLSGEDLFRSWRKKDETVALARSTSYHLGYNDTRRVGIAFTYSFGKREQKNKREHSEKIGDEKERL